MKKNRNKKNWKNEQQDLRVDDHVIPYEPYSKRLAITGKTSLLLAAGVYTVLLVIGLVVSATSSDSGSFWELQRYSAWICGTVFIFVFIVCYPRIKRRARSLQQLRFEGGMLCFRLKDKDVALTGSSILGVNQHFTRNRYGNIILWLPVYDVRTAEDAYLLDLSRYELNNTAAGWLLYWNERRNAENVRRWQAAEQAFVSSDRAAFGKKRQRIVFEQQPPAIKLGNKQLDLSAIARIVVDPTIGGSEPTNMKISFLQLGNEKKSPAFPCGDIGDEWDSFLQHLFAFAKHVNVPVEIKTQRQRDASQPSSWWG
ncbi:hypothetical protein [Paenibacillus sp. GCM10027626]|uniref:hypothetical protein n=1 Tax=Paenibacillus sp. GCM10027626 TaxID=3273411 RepID=UPI0036406583